MSKADGPGVVVVDESSLTRLTSSSSESKFFRNTSDRIRLFLENLLRPPGVLGLILDDRRCVFAGSVAGRPSLSSSFRFPMDSRLITLFLLSFRFGAVGDLDSGVGLDGESSSSFCNGFLMANLFMTNFFRPPGVFGETPNSLGDRLLRDLGSELRTLCFFLPGVVMGDSRAFKPCLRLLRLLFFRPDGGSGDRPEPSIRTELRELLPEKSPE